MSCTFLFCARPASPMARDLSNHLFHPQRVEGQLAYDMLDDHIMQKTFIETPMSLEIPRKFTFPLFRANIHKREARLYKRRVMETLTPGSRPVYNFEADKSSSFEWYDIWWIHFTFQVYVCRNVRKHSATNPANCFGRESMLQILILFQL